MQKRYICLFSVALVFISSIVSQTNAIESYDQPQLLRTITFGEEEEAQCFAKKKRDDAQEGIQRVSTSVKDKVYNLLQNGVALTEAEKTEALSAYGWLIPTAYQQMAYNVLSGNLDGVHTASLNSIAWLTGVDLDTLVAIRDGKKRHTAKRDDDDEVVVQQDEDGELQQQDEEEGDPHLADEDDDDDDEEIDLGPPDISPFPLGGSVLDDSCWIDGFYGDGGSDGYAHCSPQSKELIFANQRAQEPLGLFFRTQTAQKFWNISFNGDIYQDGGVQAYIVNQESASFAFTVAGGFRNSWKFQMSTSQSVSLTIKLYSDISCSALISANDFAVDASKYAPNDAANGKITFSGVTRCVTIANKNQGNIVVQMDNFVFGTPYAGAIIFTEPSSTPSASLTTNPLAVEGYYGEGTINSVYAAVPLGIYFTSSASSQVSTFSTDPSNHFVIGPSNGYTLRVQADRGFYNNFSVFVASNSADFSPIAFSLYTGVDCTHPQENQQIFTYPEDAEIGTVYKATAVVPAGVAITCVDIYYTNNGVGTSASISAAIFGSDLQLPSVCQTGFAGKGCAQCDTGYLNYPICYPALSSPQNYLFNKAAYLTGALNVLSTNKANRATLQAVSNIATDDNVFSFSGTSIFGTGSASGLCLDVWKKAIQVGSVVGVFNCNGQSNQKWSYTADTATGDWNQIKPYGSKTLCLAPTGGNTAVGSALSLQKCDGSDSQLWSRSATTPPQIPMNIAVSLSSASELSGVVLNTLSTVLSAQFGVSVSIVDTSPITTIHSLRDAAYTYKAEFIGNVALSVSNIQQQVLTAVKAVSSDVSVDSFTSSRVAVALTGNNQYIFNKGAYNAGSYLVFDTNYGYTSTLQSSTDIQSRVWQFTSSSTIVTNDGKCLDVYRNQGKKIGAYKCNGAYNQKWYYGNTGAWTTIKPISRPNLCLTAVQSSVIATTVELQTCNGSDDQMWRRASDAPALVSQPQILPSVF